MDIRRVITDADWEGARAVRQGVFVEEQNCPPEEEWDEHDWPSETAIHLIALADGHVVATARWRAVDLDGEQAAKLERFAVVPEYRGAGFGRAMVAAAISDAREAGYDRFILHAQTYLEDFYRSFGFRAEGDPFQEAGIPHVRMVRP